MNPSSTKSSRTSWARAALILLPALAFLALLTMAVARRADPLEPGDAAPRFSARLLSGEGSFSLKEVDDRPVVINFWASWCAPCRDEAPMLRRAHNLYGERVAFVGVDIKDSLSDATAFAESHELDYTLVRDDGRIYADYGLTGQPETFFVDSEGVIVEHVTGPLFEGDLRALLDVLVARDA